MLLEVGSRRLDEAPAMRGKRGKPIISKSLCLGACELASRGTFSWEVPDLVIPRAWDFEGTGLWRRPDGLVHSLAEWSTARRVGW